MPYWGCCRDNQPLVKAPTMPEQHDLKTDLIAYLNGNLKDWDYEEALELFTDLSLIVSVHLDDPTRITPLGVARKLYAIALADQPDLEFDDEFVSQLPNREDRLTDLHSKTAEFIMLWDQRLREVRVLPKHAPAFNANTKRVLAVS